MAIPQAELDLLTAQRTVILRVKADLAALAAACTTMSNMQTTELARLACDQAKANFNLALSAVNANHAMIGRDVIERYGAADGGAFVAQGAGGRR